jgi:hypothetical protein
VFTVLSVLFTTALAAPPRPPTIPVEGPTAPWRQREPKSKSAPRANFQGLLDPSRWGAEPETPDVLEEARLARALTQLCPARHKRHAPTLAKAVVEHAAAFKVDPALLAGLIYINSRCEPSRARNGRWGAGFIDVGMFRRSAAEGGLSYFVRDGDGWAPRMLPTPEHPFHGRRLKRVDAGVYYLAAVLRMVTDQCRDIDSAFGGVAHRHAVSHVEWGDRVRDVDFEDRVLIARRRLLRYYHGTPSGQRATRAWRGLTLSSPLDGGLRKVTSYFGAPRDGKRRHKGIDFASDTGEPVRAIADGVVYFAGAHTTHQPTKNMPASQARKLSRKQLGRGGLMVVINHGAGITSGHMHLSWYRVHRGQKIKRGDLIGTVGRSGIQRSHAHLHFEIRHNRRPLDPLKALGDLVIAPQETFRGARLKGFHYRSRKRKQAAASARE